jgi:hypothetical protein
MRSISEFFKSLIHRGTFLCHPIAQSAAYTPLERCRSGGVFWCRGQSFLRWKFLLTQFLPPSKVLRWQLMHGDGATSPRREHRVLPRSRDPCGGVGNSRSTTRFAGYRGNGSRSGRRSQTYHRARIRTHASRRLNLQHETSGKCSFRADHARPADRPLGRIRLGAVVLLSSVLCLFQTF